MKTFEEIIVTQRPSAERPTPEKSEPLAIKLAELANRSLPAAVKLLIAIAAPHCMDGTASVVINNRVLAFTF
jgi:hypothetical protein